MWLTRLWLEDFRSHERLDLSFPAGTTVLRGPNGVGKTNVVEAIVWLSRARSFRVSGNEALVRHGAERAIIRAELADGERHVTVEVELPARGRPRVLLNRQQVARTADLVSLVPVTVFGPDDLEMVKGGPGERRRYLDDALSVLSAKGAQALADLERVLKQRNALLVSCRGRLDDDAARTLDVWDEKLVQIGNDVARRRRALVDRLREPVQEACTQLAETEAVVELDYVESWSGDLADALRDARVVDIRRGVSTIGPHRDDLSISLSGLPARTHASQGEQRTVALALRVAVHTLWTDVTGSSPILVLDDVFSELDERRADRLLEMIPSGQTVITTASPLTIALAASEVTVHELGGTT